MGIFSELTTAISDAGSAISTATGMIPFAATSDSEGFTGAGDETAQSLGSGSPEQYATAIASIPLTVTGVVCGGIMNSTDGSNEPDTVIQVKSDAAAYSKVEQHASKLYQKYSKTKPASNFPVIVAQDAEVLQYVQNVFGSCDHDKILDKLDILEEFIKESVDGTAARS